MHYLYGGRKFTAVTLADYARHRIGRVVPLYFVVVMISWLLSLMGGPIWVFPIFSTRELLTHLLFLRGTGALWTVPVEIQFYLLFGGVIWLCAAYGRFWLGVVLALLAQILFLLSKMLWGVFNPGLPSWIHFFIFGAVVAEFTARGPWTSASIFIAASMTAIALATASFRFFEDPVRRALAGDHYDNGIAGRVFGA